MTYWRGLAITFGIALITAWALPDLIGWVAG